VIDNHLGVVEEVAASTTDLQTDHEIVVYLSSDTTETLVEAEAPEACRPEGHIGPL
jgi:hypothetical protein